MFEKTVFFLKENILLFIIFFTGAVVLAVEVMAVRILSPYFGNTIYSFSSVLSVILAALSVGYWQGGRTADRDPSVKHFYTLVLKAGVAVMATQLLSVFVLPVTGSMFTVLIGPLVTSVILFFYPSYVFGQLSPYVVKLRALALPNRGVGQISGEVFFVSTLGSILGSLFSGFVLIPRVGVSNSMIVLGLLVTLIGLVGVRQTIPKFRFYFFLVLGFVFSIYSAFVSTTIADVLRMGTTLYAEDGVYQRVVVQEVDGVYGERGRILVLDRSFASGISLPDGDLLFPYTRYYVLYDFFNDPSKMKNALVLGAGTGTVPKKILEDYPQVEVDMVDIEPVLFKLAHEYFMTPYSEKIREHVMDGRQFLRKAEKKYDLIFGDMYSSVSIPWHVATKEYYTILKNCLSENGVYVGNYIASLDTENTRLFSSTLRTLQEVFKHVYVFGVTSPLSGEMQNIMMVATDNDEMPVMTKFALQAHSDLRVRSLASNMVFVDPFSIEDGQVFTDDKSSVDLYASELRRK